MATAGADGSVVLFDRAAGRVRSQLAAHAKRVTGARWPALRLRQRTLCPVRPGCLMTKQRGFRGAALQLPAHAKRIAGACWAALRCRRRKLCASKPSSLCGPWALGACQYRSCLEVSSHQGQG